MAEPCDRERRIASPWGSRKLKREGFGGKSRQSYKRSIYTRYNVLIHHPMIRVMLAGGEDIGRAKKGLKKGAQKK
jgi:hypothetical protein